MLRLRRDLLDAMVAHCQAEHPIEACGLLAGRDSVPERHIPMANVAESLSFYQFDAEQQLTVWRHMDAAGETPVVIYHSHTATAAVPSKTDIAYATEFDAHYVIIGTSDHEDPEVRSYRITDGEAVEEPVTVLDPPPTGRAFLCAPTDLAKAQKRAAADDELAGVRVETHPWIPIGKAVLVDYDSLADAIGPPSWEWLT